MKGGETREEEVDEVGDTRGEKGLGEVRLGRWRKLWEV